MTFPRPRLALFAATVAAILIAVAAAAQPAAGQTPTAQPGSAAIWTDQGQYQLGAAIQACYSIPIAGPITITDLASGPSTATFFSGSPAGTSGCVGGNAQAPLGRHCLRLQYPLLGGTGTTQGCYQVAGANPPPPGPTASVVTDRSSYHVGDPLQVCYQVPGPRQVTITDVQADGNQQTFFSGYDDGTGGCISGIIVPPTGTECMLLDYGGPAGTEQPRACFTVIGMAPPPSWTVVGTQPITSGTWNFDAQAALGSNQLQVRVTSGGCSDDPAQVLVWESTLQQAPTAGIGVDVYTGDLTPVGLAVSSGGSGHARLSRPVTLNPTSQIDLTLFQLSLAQISTPLTVCFG